MGPAKAAVWPTIMPEKVSERKNAISPSTSTRAEAEAAELLAPKDSDDAVVRFFKSLGREIQERWRVLTVLVTITIVVVGIIAYNAYNTATQSRKSWADFAVAATAPTIDQLEVLQITHRGRETHPYVYLELIKRYRAGEGDKKPAERIDTLNGLISEFETTFGQQREWGFEMHRLRQLRAELQTELPLIRQVEAGSGAQKGDRPNATVAEPELGEDGKWKNLPNPQAVIRTAMGELRVELFEDLAPNTVANFLFLAEQGFYDLDGPGGAIVHEGSASDPRRLMIGGFPLSDPANRDKFYITLKDDPAADPRVKRMNEKWITRFDKRSVGYTIPFEPSAVVSRVEPGSLVMKLDRSTDMPNTPRPDTASAAFYITLGPNPEFDGKYVVFGKLADDASVAVARRVPANTAIQRIYPATLRPEMRRRQVGYIDENNQPVEVELPRLVERMPWGGSALAPGWDSADFIELPAWHEVQRTVTETATHDDGTTSEIQKRVTKKLRWVELVPSGVGYKTPSGEVKQASGIGLTVVHHFPADLDENAEEQPEPKWLTPTAVVYGADGTPKARTYQPQVRYTGFPTEIAARSTPPEAPRPLYLFGETPPPPPAPPRPATPPGLPPGFDPSRFDPNDPSTFPIFPPDEMPPR